MAGPGHGVDVAVLKLFLILALSPPPSWVLPGAVPAVPFAPSCTPCGLFSPRLLGALGSHMLFLGRQLRPAWWTGPTFSRLCLGFWVSLWAGHAVSVDPGVAA